MRTFLLHRVAFTLLGILSLTILVFVLVRFVPGDAVTMWVGQEGTMRPEVVETLRNMFGLSDPLYVQYFNWLGDVFRGDLGYSFRSRLPVLPSLLQALPVTIELAFLAMLLSAVVALPLGIISATRRNAPADMFARLLGLIGLSMPSFWIAVLLILFTSTIFGWLPSLIYVPFYEDPAENLQQFILPAIALALPLMAIVMRMTRSAMLEVLDQDYVRTARGKGLPESGVLTGHALRNAWIPIITVLGIQLGRLLGGAVIIEQIFGLPGVGSLFISAIGERDYPMVQGAVLMMGLLFILVQLVVDVSYAYVDPRIRHAS
jgi:peptide/nickel transport system permease protein